MSSAVAGKVLMIPKGNYDSSATYDVLDWVLYNGKPYVAKQTTTGNLPTNTTYWQLLLDFPTEVDSVPTQNSQNLVRSGGVYSALADKADSSAAYQTSDAAETIADADYVPFYDDSASAKKHTTYGAIKTDLTAVMTGASSGTAGTKGTVPAPAAGDNGKFLKGDGSWSNPPTPSVMTGADGTNAGTSGLVPAPEATDNNKFLKGDGTYAEVALPSDMTGATSGTAGAHGLVPAPSAGDQDKCLKGDGTWGSAGHIVADGTTTYTNRSKLKFEGFGIEDDPTNDATVIKKYTGTVCTWANGTDAEIAEMLRAHYQGELNIYDYWSVGDERVIHMDTIARTTDYSQVAARDITLILVNKGGKYLAADPSQECAFVVGFKQCIATNLVIIKDTSTTYKWENCQARTWLNESVRNAIPEAMRNLFKKHINKCTDYLSNITSVEDYLECPARVEMDGVATSPYNSEGAQFEYYQTKANRIKKIVASDTFGTFYYTRTVNTSSTNNFWGIDYQGNTLSKQGNTSFSLTAQGCI